MITFLLGKTYPRYVLPGGTFFLLQCMIYFSWHTCIVIEKVHLDDLDVLDTLKLL